MILGGTGTTLEQLVAGYTGLARGGVAGPLRYLATDLNNTEFGLYYDC